MLYIITVFISTQHDHQNEAARNGDEHQRPSNDALRRYGMFGQPISSLFTPLQCSEALTDNYRKLYSRSLSHRGAAATAVHCREDIEILKYGKMSLQVMFTLNQ